MVSFIERLPRFPPHAAACSLPPTASASGRLPQSLSSPTPILQPRSFSLPSPFHALSFLLPLQLAPPRCLKRAFSFRLSLGSYDSIGKTAAPGCRVTLGIRLLVSRARSPAYKGPLCTAHARGVILAVHRIACIAGLRGPLLTCRSRNDASAATSAAQRLLFGL
jgi:hypothetical protein